ncbi:hypothetical protein BC941DRAFT_36775 [Chlamydoabsidia padenii]|nr:hypothetical protein BC941DRAFT_36775 [Chlamydoabsidia padenii]
MILDSPTITIKQEPDALQEEQDDVVLSYLNSDYVTTDTMTSTESNDPPSPPYSTSSASTDAAPSLMDLDMDLSMDNNTSSLYTQDPFLLHLQTTLNQQGMPFSWPTATWPMGPIQGGADPCLLDLSTNPLSFLSPSPPLYQPGDQQQKQPEQHSKKKGGGRKKREVSIAPAPLTPILPATTPEHHVLKQETSVTPSLDNQQDERSPAEIAHAKRQERLIKNRAAALMSRKRKREHLTTLEEERQQLTNENQSLRSKVSSLEARVVSLEQENMELKRKLSSSSSSSIGHKQHQHHHISLATPKHAKTTGMVFMVRANNNDNGNNITNLII